MYLTRCTCRISAARSNVTELISELQVHSFAGKRCNLRLPFAVGTVVVKPRGASAKRPVLVQRYATDTWRFQFDTEANVTYEVVATRLAPRI